MEENMAKFLEKLKELVALGKKKKSVLELQEINDFFADMELDSDQMEKVFEYLESNNIDVLRISDDDDIDDVDIMISEEDDALQAYHRTPSSSRSVLLPCYSCF